jgi:hypothetical protein
MAIGPVESQRRTPVVNDQHDLLAWSDKLVDQRPKIGPVRLERVGLWAGIRQFLGLTHSDQIGRDEAATAAKLGDDVSPEIGRRGISVKEDDRNALTLIIIGHPLAENVGGLLG